MKEFTKIETDSFILYGYNKCVNLRKPYFVLHREAEPAVVHMLKDQVEWFIDGEQVNVLAYQWLKDHSINHWQSMTDEDKFALSFYMRSL